MALNIFSLLLVLGFLVICGLVASRYSRRKRDYIPLDGNFEADITDSEEHLECPTCNGAGAKNYLGGIHVCESCNGMGVVNSPSTKFK